MSVDKKVKKEYYYGGDKYEVSKVVGDIKFFLSVENANILLITDMSDNVIQVVSAGCGQNQGYLELEE